MIKRLTERAERLLLLMLLGAVLSGCQSPARYSTQAPRRHLTPQQVAEHNARLGPYEAIATDRKIEILSEPAGARIEVNDDYVGDTPTTISVPCTPDGRFTENTVIRATPTRPGDYTQTKFFSGGYGYGYRNLYRNLNSSIPKRIFFDMRLGPVPESIDINLTE